MPLIPSNQPPYYETGTTEGTKYYIVSGTQTGTAPPVYIEHLNTIGTITSVRYGVGSYGLESTGLFTAGKTWIAGQSATDGTNGILMPIGTNGISHVLKMQWESEDEIYIDLFIAAGANAEWIDVLGTIFLPQIIVYP